MLKKLIDIARPTTSGATPAFHPGHTAYQAMKELHQPMRDPICDR